MVGERGSRERAGTEQRAGSAVDGGEGGHLAPVDCGRLRPTVEDDRDSDWPTGGVDWGGEADPAPVDRGFGRSAEIVTPVNQHKASTHLLRLTGPGAATGREADGEQRVASALTEVHVGCYRARVAAARKDRKGWMRQEATLRREGRLEEGRTLAGEYVEFLGEGWEALLTATLEGRGATAEVPLRTLAEYAAVASFLTTGSLRKDNDGWDGQVEDEAVFVGGQYKAVAKKVLPAAVPLPVDAYERIAHALLA